MRWKAAGCVQEGPRGPAQEFFKKHEAGGPDLRGDTECGRKRKYEAKVYASLAQRVWGSGLGAGAQTGRRIDCT